MCTCAVKIPQMRQMPGQIPFTIPTHYQPGRVGHNTVIGALMKWTNQFYGAALLLKMLVLLILGELSVESGGIHWCWRHVSYGQCHKQHGEALEPTTSWRKHHSITKTSYFSWWIWKMHCLEVSRNIFHGDGASYDLVIIITTVFISMLCVVCQHPTTLKVHGWQLEYVLKNNISLLRNLFVWLTGRSHISVATQFKQATNWYIYI